MRFLTVFLIFLSLGQKIWAQEKEIFTCSYGAQTANNDDCINVSSSINSDIEAILIVDKILQPIGLKRNFVLISCSDINNALAITSKSGIRYIVYDKKFISTLKDLSSQWTNASILAHEIGHHLLGHTLKASLSLTELRQKELDADEFSGFILFKLGASLQQSQAAINLTSTDASDINSTHPSRSKRLLAIKTGYDKANASQIIKYVKVGPDPEEFFIKAYKLTDEAKYDEAMDNYTTAIGINPKFAEAYMNRAQVRFQLAPEKRKFSEIINDCNKAIQLNPKLGIAYYNRGLAEMLDGDYDLALNDFDLGLKLDPSIDGHQFFLNRAFVQQKIKEKSKTLAALKNDIEKNPNNALTYFQMGQKLMEVEAFQDAILNFTKAIQKDKSNAAFFDCRGYAKGKLGLYKEAIKDFDTSIRLDPNIYISYENRAYAYKALDDFDKALADFNICVILQPDNEEFLIQRGYARRRVNAHEGALEDFNKLIELNPKNDVAWLERAVTKAEMGEFKDAIEDLNRALAANSTSENISYHYYHRGLCKLSLGDKVGGCQDLKKSCELGLTEACNDLKEYCE